MAEYIHLEYTQASSRLGRVGAIVRTPCERYHGKLKESRRKGGDDDVTSSA
jgi:hypothetical protein